MHELSLVSVENACTFFAGYAVRELARFVLQPSMLAITETGDETNGNLLMGNDWAVSF